MLAAQARSYDLSHAWQYEIRLKNFDQDLKESGLTEIEIKSLRIKDFEFRFVPNDEKTTCLSIVKFIERHEWLGKMPTRPTHRFTATYKGHLAGVIVMATPNSFSNLLGEENRNLEKLISRGACISWSPKNLASALVMFSIRWMAEHTGFRIFTAYGDVEARELGTIYQACNFTYLGQNSGARVEYFDPNFPDSGWFTDRQFRQTSQVKRYARDLMIPWKSEWSDGDGINWEKVPKDITAQLKAQSEKHQRRCKKRSVQPKHKYVFLLGQDRRETKRLRDAFKTQHPDLQNISYPKTRGPELNTAANQKMRPNKTLTENFEACRPQEEVTQNKSPYVTVKELAQMMRVSQWTIYSIIKTDRTFPVSNIGLKKKFVIDRTKLTQWLERKTKRTFLADSHLPFPEDLLNTPKGVTNG
jgi:predicted DNA-binding transcriptional regulator AlpA